MNEFLIQLQAILDREKSKSNVTKSINRMQSQLDKLKLQAELDPKTVTKLVEKIEKVTNQKITISNIDTGQALKNAQQTGAQIGNAINQGVENSVNKTNKTLKSFSELKIGTGNIKAKFDKNGLLDVEKSLKEIKEKYSKFGQVKITDKLFDSNGNLKQFRVNIQQLNGDLKESRSFMMALDNSGKSFGFPKNVIKGSESYVHHLNDAKKTTNEILTEEQKLANIMADVREKSEQTRKAEEKRQQLAQSSAINKSLEQEYNQRQKIFEQLSSKVNKIQLSIGTNGDTTSQIETLRNNFSKLGLSADDVKTKMNKVETELSQLKSLINSGANDNAIVSQFDKLKVALNQTQNNLKTTRSEYSLLATEQQRLSKANQIEAWNQKNSAATRQVIQTNESYIASLRDLNSQMTDRKSTRLNSSH